jgi:hypothetical protein
MSFAFIPIKLTGRASETKDEHRVQAASIVELTGEELLLDDNSLRNDRPHNVGVGATLQVAEEQAGKVCVHALVARDKLIGEGEAGHETTFLEPEDWRKRAWEEDTLNGGERDQALAERALLVGDPSERPLRLLLDARDRLDSVEEEVALSRLLDERVDEERVSLGVDVLHHNLEAVEAAGLGDLDLVGEAFEQVLVDDAVRGSEERQDMWDEVALVVVQTVVPVVQVLRKVHLLGRPKGCLRLLVHLPDLGCGSVPETARSNEATCLLVLDGEKDEATLGLLE